MTENNEANMTVPEMKLENVPVPVSDVDRAKAFYDKVSIRRSTNEKNNCN
jgi:predicted enzyme related to lactoylglutathione lyase